MCVSVCGRGPPCRSCLFAVGGGRGGGGIVRRWGGRHGKSCGEGEAAGRAESRGRWGSRQRPDATPKLSGGWVGRAAAQKARRSRRRRGPGPHRGKHALCALQAPPAGAHMAAVMLREMLSGGLVKVSVRPCRGCHGSRGQQRRGAVGGLQCTAGGPHWARWPRWPRWQRSMEPRPRACLIPDP